MNALTWTAHEGIKGVQAPLSVSGDYVISHRPEDHTVCWRPEGRHVHLASFKTEAEAKAAAQKWEDAGRPVDPNPNGSWTEFASGFPRWWKGETA